MSQTVHSPQTPTSYEDAPLCALHKKVIAGGMLGQFSDGYILGSIGISMSLATTALALDSWWLGLIGAASLVGLMVGSFFMGPIADRIGRKPIFCTTMVVFTVASIMQFFVESASQLFILRLILGLALGADYAVGLTIVSEWSPARLRPRILSTLMIMWVSGYVSAYITGYFLQFIGDGSWRVILLSCAVPSALAMYVRLGTPESPSWLISKGKGYRAEELVHKFIGAQYSLPGDLNATPQKTSWSMLFSPQWKKNAIVGGTFFACQVIPYFSLSIFLPQIFKQLGMENPYASGIVFNLFLFMGVLVGTWLIDKISRRSFLISSFYICALALGLLMVYSGSTLWSLACISVFSFTISAASVLEFAYPPELFNAELRASGVGFCVACSRVGGAGGTFLLPIVMEWLGTSAALAGCVAALVIGGYVCQRMAPETHPGKRAHA